MWSFLHSHPFYNSEQSSQRFVRLDEPRAYVPPDSRPRRATVYEQAVAAAWEAYRELSALLKEDACAHPERAAPPARPNAPSKRRKKVAREAEKKAIELARYVIPVAAFTSMVHTVSGIVLHRLLPHDAHRATRRRERAWSSARWCDACARSIPRSSTRSGDGPLDAAERRGGALARAARRRRRARPRASTRGSAARTSLLVDYIGAAPRRRRRTPCAPCSALDAATRWPTPRRSSARARTRRGTATASRR